MMQVRPSRTSSGVTVRSGARYSTWWNGGLRSVPAFHNMHGILTETPAILAYVAQRFPAARLAPADPFAFACRNCWQINHR